MGRRRETKRAIATKERVSTDDTRDILARRLHPEVLHKRQKQDQAGRGSETEKRFSAVAPRSPRARIFNVIAAHYRERLQRWPAPRAAVSEPDLLTRNIQQNQRWQATTGTTGTGHTVP